MHLFMYYLCLFLWGLTFAAIIQPEPPESSIEKTLKSRQWQNRIVLIYGLTAEQAAFAQQKQLLASEAAGVDERDIVVIDAIESQLSATDRLYLQTELGLPTGRFGVVLIGKDGGVKLRQAAPIRPQTLFATIDGMSMRQREMRERKRASGANE